MTRQMNLRCVVLRLGGHWKLSFHFAIIRSNTYNAVFSLTAWLSAVLLQISINVQLSMLPPVTESIWMHRYFCSGDMMLIVVTVIFVIVTGHIEHEIKHWFSLRCFFHENNTTLIYTVYDYYTIYIIIYNYICYNYIDIIIQILSQSKFFMTGYSCYIFINFTALF